MLSDNEKPTKILPGAKRFRAFCRLAPNNQFYLSI
jgi:hypothetical protein